MDRFEAGFVALNKWVLIVILAVMSVIIFTNVSLRYLTSHSIEWAEEVARHLVSSTYAEILADGGEPHRDHGIVEEGIDLVQVVTLFETHSGEPLVPYVLRRERHSESPSWSASVHPRVERNGPFVKPTPSHAPAEARTRCSNDTPR